MNRLLRTIGLLAFVSCSTEQEPVTERVECAAVADDGTRISIRCSTGCCLSDGDRLWCAEESEALCQD